MPDREIPPPSGDREPLKVNVYRFVQTSRTSLAPLFPFFDEGSIVPCAATFKGGPGVEYSRFQHFNTVDEIVLTFGAQGARKGGGVVRVGPRLHMVHSPFEDESNPENIALAVITQRQSTAKPQKEEFRFVCEKCDRRLSMGSFDATPPQRGKQHESLGPNPAFPTIKETLAAAEAYNADQSLRTCKHCGHENKPFPSEAWGWRFYVEQAEISDAAYDAMAETFRRPANKA